MDTKALLIGLIALIIGAGGGYAVANTQTSDRHPMADGSMMHGAAHGMENEMDEMMMGLAGKRGDDFDRAFLSGMILHHEGAVAMAEAALRDAKHDEIKQMAQAIIAAQTTEIDQMHAWSRDWYGE